MAYLLGNRLHVEPFSSGEVSHCIADTTFYESKVECRPLPESGDTMATDIVDFYPGEACFLNDMPILISMNRLMAGRDGTV